MEKSSRGGSRGGDGGGHYRSNNIWINQRSDDGDNMEVVWCICLMGVIIPGGVDSL